MWPVARPTPADNCRWASGCTGGCVPFVTPEQFDTIYWPTLKPIILELWRQGHQTLFYAEGDWNHHLDAFAELPPASIVYHVDHADIFAVHRRLGDRFCLSGGIPNTLLWHGSPDDVRAYAKKVIDGVAADGGYIMDASAIMQNDTSIENLRALTDFTHEYGVYGPTADMPLRDVDAPAFAPGRVRHPRRLAPVRLPARSGSLPRLGRDPPRAAPHHRRPRDPAGDLGQRGRPRQHVRLAVPPFLLMLHPMADTMNIPLPSLATLALALAALACHGAPLALHIAPNGNDAWSGTLARPTRSGQDGPFATLGRARDEIRRRKEAGELPKEGAAVLLQGGDYPVTEALRFEEQDSGTPEGPITYAAAPGQTAALRADREIGGFAPVTDPAILARLPEEARGNVVQSDLRQQGIKDFGKIGLRTKQTPQAGLELFVDSRPMTLARWPNEGFARVAGAPKGAKGGEFAYSGDRPSRWLAEPDARGCGYWAHDWAASHVAFAQIDPESRIIATKAPHSNYGYRKGGRYFAYNLLAELDRPGEWYLDRETGVLYLWPEGDLAAAKVAVSMGPGFLSLANVSHVRFRGLVFAGCRGQAITIEGGTDVQLVACTLRNLGTRAVSINKGTRHRVAGCDFHDINEGGISCSGGDRASLTPAHHVIENCVFTRLARWQRTYVPAVQLSGVGSRVAHNLMYDIPHSVLLFGGNDHVIEYNEVHSMGFEGGEMGAFYCGRNWTLNGNIIRYNYLHDIYNPCPQRNRAFMLDDGAAGITMLGNLIVRVAEGISLSSLNNVIDNNVFVDCHPAVGCWGGSLAFPPFDPEAGHNPTKWPRLAELALDQPPWSFRFPEMLPLREAIRTGGSVPLLCRTRLTRNVAWGGAEQWTGFHRTEDKGAWVIENNLVGADPRFRNPARDDYRLRPASPARSIGFEPLPLAKMGVQNTPERASWPVRHEVRADMCRDFTYVRPPKPPREQVPPIRAPRLAGSPTIDGTLAKGEWPMPAVAVEQLADGDTTFSPSRAWVGWDSEALYVAFRNPVNGASPIDSGAKWGKSDAVEIALRRGGDAKAPILVLRGFAGGAFASSDEAKAPAEAVRQAAQGVQYAAKAVGPALWTCEWRVPFASLGIDPRKDRTLEFNLTVRKVADNLWIMWAGTGAYSWQVEQAGRLELVDAAAPK